MAAGGALVATGGALGSLYVGSTTASIGLFGMSRAQTVAVGALSFDVFPMIVAPFFGIESEPIELP